MLKVSSVFFSSFIFIAHAFAAETQLQEAEILAALSEKTLQQIRPTTKWSIEQTFRSTGSTNYVVDGQQQQGMWKLENNKYCSTWPPSTQWECYDIYADGKEIIFQSRHGARYVFAAPMP